MVESSQRIRPVTAECSVPTARLQLQFPWAWYPTPPAAMRVYSDRHSRGSGLAWFRPLNGSPEAHLSRHEPKDPGAP